MGAAPDKLVNFEEALAIVHKAFSSQKPRPAETVDLLASAGRVLAENLIADRDQPPFHRATRDGFALRAAEATTSLRIAGQIRAGALPGVVAAGEAVEIMTGAALPDGADAVAMVEHVILESGTVQLVSGRTLTAGENVVPRGAEARVGDILLRAGTRIGAAEIAIAASCGYARLLVFERPLVAIVATGDELVEVAETPGPQQIRNSNSDALAALVTAAGGIPGRLAIAPDLRQEIHERIAQGRMWDLLVLSGGVSMGEYDLVEEVLTEFDAEFLFTGVRMQPGKPAVFGRLPARQHHPQGSPEPECYFFGLPGNPVSTEVTFHCFVEMFVHALAGQTEPHPKWAQAALAEPVAAKPGLTRLLPARMSGTSISLVHWQGSGDLAANARANCYAELLPGREYVPGDILRVLLR